MTCSFDQRIGGKDDSTITVIGFLGVGVDQKVDKIATIRRAGGQKLGLMPRGAQVRSVQ
jgi:hypothetical protein